MKRHSRSLSWLLFWLLLGIIGAGGVSSGYLAYRSGVIEAGELFDAKLAHSARVLRSLVDAALDESDGRAPPLTVDVWSGIAEGQGADLATPTGHLYETKLAFQVFRADGTLLLASDNAPAIALAPFRAGYADPLIEGQRWRSFVLRSEGERWYIAGERWDVRADIAGDIAKGILLPLAVELPLVALLVAVVIRYGSNRLRRVTAEIEVRAANELQPIDLRDAPTEISHLVEALNRLLANLDSALQGERRFTADAAHELRTPIAALRVHLANLADAPDPAARARTECALAEGLLRLERLVEQMLTLSRLEPGAVLPERQPVELVGLARQVAGELIDAGLGKGIDLELEGESPVTACGDASSLGVLLRNLLDNALRYTPAQGRVRLRIARVAGSAVLCCEDSGPGIPVDQRERVLRRFHRLLGTGVVGSGLGLSIAARVAVLHGGQLTLGASALGGLRADVTVPLATASTA
jgi:two-component system sensor histidine kinase QseC